MNKEKFIEDLEYRLSITDRRIAEYEDSRPLNNQFTDLEKLRFNEGYYYALEDILKFIEDW